jgi:hypothetical protein
MKKARSSYDLAPRAPDLKFKNPMKYQSSADLGALKSGNKNDGGKHKVVIYFSDAYNNICNKTNGTQSNQDNDNDNDIDHNANRLSNDVQSKPAKDFMAQLKTVLEEKSKFTNKFCTDSGASRVPAEVPKKKPAVPVKPNVLQINQCAEHFDTKEQQMNEKSLKLLPSYIESIDENNVIKLKIEQNFRRASELVSLISSLPKNSKLRKNVRRSDASNETSSIHELNFSHEEMNDVNDDNDEDVISEPDEGYFYDWSFVQEWRSR